MNVTVPEKIIDLLKAIVAEDLSEFTIDVQQPNKKGDGYLGEIRFVDLKNKKNGQEYNFVVKQAFSDEAIRSVHPIRDVFLNEIYFYTKIWTRYQTFQEEEVGRKIFDKFGKCFYTDAGDNTERLVFENLKRQDFELVDKRGVFDQEHVEFVLKEYGKFHGVSFCFKKLHPEDQLEFARELRDMYAKFFEKDNMRSVHKQMHELVLQSLRPGEDDDVIDKYKHYVEDGFDIFGNNNNYKGKYAVIVHGDCWSNNFLFKYNETRKLVDVRFLDLQLSKQGTPVLDLSYFLYSGGSKEIFSDLNHYLQVYHNSLSETIRAFGLDPEELYPFKALQKDWKLHCQVGFIMGLMLWRGKLTHDSEIMDLTDMVGEEDYEKFNAAKYDEETFKKRTRDLILHMYENDFL